MPAVPMSALIALRFSGSAGTRNILLPCNFIRQDMAAPHIRLTDFTARIVRHAWLGNSYCEASFDEIEPELSCLFALKHVFRILVQTKISTL